MYSLITDDTMKAIIHYGQVQLWNSVNGLDCFYLLRMSTIEIKTFSLQGKLFIFIPRLFVKSQVETFIHAPFWKSSVFLSFLQGVFRQSYFRWLIADGSIVYVLFYLPASVCFRVTRDVSPVLRREDVYKRQVIQFFNDDVSETY